MGVERGCLVLADISGYTGYLTGVELEHSHDVLADLLDTIVRGAEGVLTLSKLEGDAVFWYAREGHDPKTLIPAIEACYAAFRRRVRTIDAQTTCDCNACRRIPELDLKFVAHAGEFVVRAIAGAQELVGSDVIVAHRLLKNEVTERLGLRGYALLTDRFVQACGLGGSALGLPGHVETYGDVGEVRCHVLDLDERWRTAEAGRLAYVEPGQAFGGAIETEIVAPAAVVWEYLTDPRKRPLWARGVKRVEQANPGGLPGVGTINHCVHGASAAREEILDWKPFSYFTFSSAEPGGRFLFTCELRPLGTDRTLVSWRVVPESLRARVLARPFRLLMAKTLREGMARIERLAAEERAGGVR